MDTILIVEDERPIAEVVQNYLVQLGYRVAGMVDSGADALRNAAETRPGLAIVDIGIRGEMDGFELAERFHAEFNIPVIFLTGGGDPATLERVRRSECYGYLLKPFRFEELKAGIELALIRHGRETHLKKVERVFSAAIRSLGEGVILSDASRMVTFMNPAAERLTGWSFRKGLGQPLESVFQAVEGGAAAAESLDRLFRGAERGAFVYDINLVTAAGRELPVEVNVALVRDDLRGPAGSVLIFRDITQRKRSENDLFNSQQMLRTVLDHIPQRVFWKDRNSVYFGCNKLLAQDAGYADPCEIVGKTDYDTASAATAELYRADDRHVMDSDQSKINYEEPQFKADGSRSWLRTSKVPLHDKSGRVIGVLGTYDDISERKRFEEELTESRNQLRALAGHLGEARETERGRLARDLRGQVGDWLAGLKSDLGSIQQKLAEPAKANSDLLDKARSMSATLDEMARFIERAAVELQPAALEKGDLEAAVKWQVEEFERRTGIRCSLDATISGRALPPETITLVFRGLVELLANVEGHAGAKTARIDLRESDGAVVLEISDDGRGITDEDTRKPGVFGLLTLRERAALLRGKLEIKGNPGQGTTARLTLPLTR